jgi:hypothetical protein
VVILPGDDRGSCRTRSTTCPAPPALPAAQFNATVVAVAYRWYGWRGVGVDWGPMSNRVKVADVGMTQT